MLIYKIAACLSVRNIESLPLEIVPQALFKGLLILVIRLACVHGGTCSWLPSDTCIDLRYSDALLLSLAPCPARKAYRYSCSSSCADELAPVCIIGEDCHRGPVPVGILAHLEAQAATDPVESLPPGGEQHCNQVRSLKTLE